MYRGNDLSDIEIKKLEKIKNPTVTKIIELSKELNIDIKVLAEYFIDKTTNEIENEKLN
ncbi:hypothetical protein [Paraclostridium bifermentans]|uniref:hypothetical protein n=1 Tax=Paraclostridium bifermentans TaxID=1490 RepID=UPI0025B0016A|nr:hypothetical protein [Paraclostridium bifermentans]